MYDISVFFPLQSHFIQKEKTRTVEPEEGRSGRARHGFLWESRRARKISREPPKFAPCKQIIASTEGYNKTVTSRFENAGIMCRTVTIRARKKLRNVDLTSSSASDRFF